MVETKDKGKSPINQGSDEERSVEDILSSIRQMIANEIDVSKKMKDPEAPFKGRGFDSVVNEAKVEVNKGRIADSDAIDILELTTEIDENGNVLSTSNRDNISSSEEEGSDKKKISKDGQNKPLLTEASESSAIDAFAFLASEIKATNGVSGDLNNDSKTIPTLEDIVKSTLRPMLRNWLDKNLEKIIRNLVQREIERISEQSSKK